MNIGRKIRQLRQAKGWTLVELTRRTGVALSSLSRIETGKMTGTLESHLAMARSLGVRLPELYADLDSSGAMLEVRSAAAPATKIVHSPGTDAALLTTGTLRKKMLPAFVKIRPGRLTPKEHHPFGTERFLYLLKGRLEVTAGEQTLRLNAGDSLYLSASTPHQLKNVGASVLSVLSVTTPPSL